MSIHTWKFDDLNSNAKKAFSDCGVKYVSESDDSPAWVKHEYGKNSRVFDMTLRLSKAGRKQGYDGKPKLRGRIATNPRIPGDNRSNEVSGAATGTFLGGVWHLPQEFKLPNGSINGILDYHWGMAKGKEVDSDSQPLTVGLTANNGGVWKCRSLCGDDYDRKFAQDIGKHIPILLWMKSRTDNQGGCKMWFPDVNGNPELVLDCKGRTIPQGASRNVTKLQTYCEWNAIRPNDKGPTELPLYLCALTMATGVMPIQDGVNDVWGSLTGS